MFIHQAKLAGWPAWPGWPDCLAGWPTGWPTGWPAQPTLACMAALLWLACLAGLPDWLPWLVYSGWPA